MSGNWRLSAVVSALVILLGAYYLVWTVGGWDTEDEIAQKEKSRARGEDPGPDLAAWNQLLARKRADLPPQLLPAGWLTASR